MIARRITIGLALLLAVALPESTQANGNGEVSTDIYNVFSGQSVTPGSPCYLYIRIANDAELTGMSIGFEISYVATCLFDPDWSDNPQDWPYVQRIGRGASGFDEPGEFQVIAKFDGVSPDTVLITGSGEPGNGLPAGPADFCFSLRFMTDCSYWAQDGFCADNITVPPAGDWYFDDGEFYAPTYHGIENTGPDEPDAPPYCYLIEELPALPPMWTSTPEQPIAQSQCESFTFTFAAVENGNIPPGYPIWYEADVGQIDSTTGAYLLEPPETGVCESEEVTVTAWNLYCNGIDYTFTVDWTNSAPQITDCPTTVGKVAVGQTYNYQFAVDDADECDIHDFSVGALEPSPVGPYTITPDGYLEFSPDPADEGQTFTLHVDVHDPCFAEDACDLQVMVEMPRCGDANGDDLANITDVVYLINYIFSGGLPPNPLFVGDTDCDGLVNIADAVYIICWIFGGEFCHTPCEDCPY